MAACTSESPAMAPAGLFLCLLLQATFALSSTATSETSALRSPSKKPIRKIPFFPSQQELESFNVAPADYDLALLNDNDLSAFEEETAIENKLKRAKDKDEIPIKNYEDISSNDVDFSNYDDSDKPKTLNYDYYAFDPSYDTKINHHDNSLTNKQLDTEINNHMHNIKKEIKDSSSNYENIDENTLKVNRNDDSYINKIYGTEINNVPKTDDFELLNEDYAQIDMLRNADGVRKKRETESTLNKTKPRAVTGDTVLNIAGAVSDTIGELAPFASPPSRAPPPGFPPSAPSGATRLDTVVIRSAASAAPPPPEQTSTEADEQWSEVQEDGVVTAEVGAKVELRCDVPGTGAVTWTRDNEHYPDYSPRFLSRTKSGSAREKYFFGYYRGDCRLTPALLQMVGGAAVAGGGVRVRAARGVAGAWRCARGDQRGQAITLRIYEPAGEPWLRVEGRRLDGGRAWLPAREGTTLSLACHADGGVPPPVLVWRVDPASHLLSHNRTTYRDGVATSWAWVLATRELHNASITCSAMQRDPTYRLGAEGAAGIPGGGGGRDKGGRGASVMLHVTYPPTFSISRRPGFGRPLMSGRGAVLRCDVSANPTPHVAWTRQDEPLPQDTVRYGAGWAEARWEALSRAAAGWYRCTCHWGGQTYSSIGYFLMLLPEANADIKLADPQRCPSGVGGCRRPDVSEPRAAGSRPDKAVQSGVAGAASAQAVPAVPAHGAVGAAGWRRVSCRVCGAAARARWLVGALAVGAELEPASASATSAQPHCRTTVYTAPSHEEVWCVAVNALGGGVAVFPPLSPRPPPASSPPPASPRAASAAPTLLAPSVLLVLVAISHHI